MFMHQSASKIQVIGKIFGIPKSGQRGNRLSQGQKNPQKPAFKESKDIQGKAFT